MNSIKTLLLRVFYKEDTIFLKCGLWKTFMEAPVEVFKCKDFLLLLTGLLN